MDKSIRITLLIVVGLLTALAWLITYAEARNMGALMQLGVPMSLGMEGWGGIASFVAFTGMWVVMMVAMMLPSSYPTLLLHRTVYRKRTPSARGGTLIFATSYFLVWAATGTFFYAGYLLLGWLREGSPGVESAVLRAAGVALIVSGLYQWSRLKQACLKHCQNPLHFIMEHWRDGRSGAFRMGAAHGGYCVGCCWGLMVILFVMGIMHLGWMAAIGALILLEKLVPFRKLVSNAIGVVFVVLGVIVALDPGVLSQFSSQVTLAH